RLWLKRNNFTRGNHCHNPKTILEDVGLKLAGVPAGCIGLRAVIRDSARNVIGVSFVKKE
ncbi:hypothetical protein PanWU01x14_019870, partial [Parasponia andersonii]